MREVDVAPGDMYVFRSWAKTCVIHFVISVDKKNVVTALSKSHDGYTIMFWSALTLGELSTDDPHAAKLTSRSSRTKVF